MFASRDHGVALAPVWGSVGNGRAYFNSMGVCPADDDVVGHTPVP